MTEERSNIAINHNLTRDITPAEVRRVRDEVATELLIRQLVDAIMYVIPPSDGLHYHDDIEGAVRSVLSPTTRNENGEESGT